MRRGIEFTVPGPPVPKGRPRVYKTRGVTPKRTRMAEQHVRTVFKTTFPDFTPFEGRLRVACEFWMPKQGRPDVDNLLKLVTDALNGLAYQDDEQIMLLQGARILPDRMVAGARGMRKRNSKDPLTHHGEPYDAHTLVRITPTQEENQ